MKKYNGQNIHESKSRLNTQLIFFASIIVLVIIILLLFQTGRKTVASVTFNNYKVKLLYKITWDNYCQDPTLEITNLKDHSHNTIKSNSYQGPCGHDHPSSFWLRTGDFNQDGHRDFSILSVYDISGKTGNPAYTEFIYTPSAPTSMPFIQQQ